MKNLGCSSCISGHTTTPSPWRRGSRQPWTARESRRAVSTSMTRVRILDLVRYYLRLGALGFGGPVALCGQMERELAQERKWLTKDEMREEIAVCQSMPGPLA